MEFVTTPRALKVDLNQQNMNLAVDDPTIPGVLELSTGQYKTLAEVVGGDRGEVSVTRFSIKDAQLVDQPIYLCAECFVPVSLLMHPSSRRFYFKHTMEDGRCSAVTRGLLNQTEINARKYNGAKESYLHREMKEWLVRALGVDGRFSQIAVEQRWNGAIDGKWRKPDVQATYELESGERIHIAFEIQLSTTFLDVIAERRRFYLENGGLLIWVFSEFNETGRRLTQDDVFYNNNRNAFVLSHAAADASKFFNHFHLECLWPAPGQPLGTHELSRKIVAFSELQLDLDNQRAYYFDYDGEQVRQEAAMGERLSTIRETFEAQWIAPGRTRALSLQSWNDLAVGMRMLGIAVHSRDGYLPHALIDALYSVKHGSVIGWRYRLLIEVAHRIAGAHKGYLKIFGHAIRTFQRIDQIRQEDRSGKWRDLAEKCNKAIRANNPDYLHDGRYDEWLRVLFPELPWTDEPWRN